MKKAINAWTVDPAAGFEQMFAQVKAAGFDGIELNVDGVGFSAHSLSLETSAEQLKAILELSDRYDLPVVSISSSQFMDKLGGRQEFESAKQLIRKQLECASALRAGGILTVPGGVSDSASWREVWERSSAIFSEMKPEIERARIYVGVENVWNGFFMSPFDMARYIDALDCPFIGAYYDVGNTLAFSWTEYWIDELGRRIHNVHVKDFKRTGGGFNQGGAFRDLTEGDANWPRIMDALRRAEFDGYLTCEVSKEDPDMPYERYYERVSQQLDKILEA